jgi:hypothetical protein
MAALSGKYAAFFRSYGTSTSATAEAMTRVGSTLEYYIADRTKRIWDPAYAVTAKDGGVAVTGRVQVDHAGGYVTLPAAPSGAVTVDCYYKTIESLGGGYQWTVTPKVDTIDTTTFSQTLNSTSAWKTYIAALRGWDGTVSAHWFYGRATLAHGNITYTAVPTGTAGNSVSIIHSDPGEGDQALDVTVAGNVITVSLQTTGGTPVSTEAQVVAAVNLDAEANLLVSASYTGNGTAVVATKTSTALSGGRDSGEELAKAGTKIMCEFYMDNTTGSYNILRGVGTLIGVSPNVAIESIIEGDLSYQGTDRLRYHTT